MILLLQLVYLALPAFVANAMPVFASHFNLLPFLAKPIDRGLLWNGKRLLGEHKTWRGFVFAVLGALVTVLVQYFETFPIEITTRAYDSLLVAIVYGISVGVLVMVGDALGSVLKRQFDLKSGEPSIPLDQIDYILVFIVGTLPFTAWGMVPALVLIVFTFFLNIGTNVIAYVTGVKNTYW